MEKCSFLSTNESYEECFKDCALYNYIGTGGICPFKNIDDFSSKRIEDRRNEIELFQEELNFLREYYLEVSNKYL